MQRGHNDEVCFFGEEDYQAYLYRAQIEATTGQRREARPRVRPRVRQDEAAPADDGQGELQGKQGVFCLSPTSMNHVPTPGTIGNNRGQTTILF